MRRGFAFDQGHKVWRKNANKLGGQYAPSPNGIL